MKKSALFTVLLLVVTGTAEANVVWPALYTETKTSSIPVIVGSLVIEYFVFQWLFKTEWKKTALYVVSANLVSGLLGLILRPLSGIAWELSLGAVVMWLFNWGTFNPVAWFFVPIIGGAVNAAIELYTVKLFWGEKFQKKSFMVLWAANWVTVGAATLWVVISPPQM
jgi:hypothetical protein